MYGQGYNLRKFKSRATCVNFHGSPSLLLLLHALKNTRGSYLFVCGSRITFRFFPRKVRRTLIYKFVLQFNKCRFARHENTDIIHSPLPV